MELHQTDRVDFSTPSITFVELTGVEAAEVALLDLAFSDEEWLHEQETTEFVPARRLRGLTKGRRTIKFGDNLLEDPWFKSIVA
ncbi:MAG: hypothetical protein JRI68_16625 [Deltaproteobacteria bacterium]|nr:hypothetical protein [Deltaproteobacteria bacterium]